MSFLSKVLPKGAAPTARAIAEELTLVAAEIERLQQEERQQSFFAVSGVTGADAALRKVREALASAFERQRTLEAAALQARQNEFDAAVQAQAKIHEGKVRAIKAHLAKRRELYEKLSGAITVAAEAWHGILDVNETVGPLWPANIPKPAGGALFAQSEVERALKVEMHRIGGVEYKGNIVNQMRRFPGGHESSINFQGNPRAEKPITILCDEANAFALRCLTGKGRGDASVVSEPEQAKE